MRADLVMIAAIPLAACAGSQYQANEPEACRDTKLDDIVLECAEQIKAACGDKPYATCPERTTMQAECNRRIDEWEKCSK